MFFWFYQNNNNERAGEGEKHHRTNICKIKFSKMFSFMYKNVFVKRVFTFKSIFFTNFYFIYTNFFFVLFVITSCIQNPICKYLRYFLGMNNTTITSIGFLINNFLFFNFYKIGKILPILSTTIQLAEMNMAAGLCRNHFHKPFCIHWFIVFTIEKYKKKENFINYYTLEIFFFVN